MSPLHSASQVWGRRGCPQPNAKVLDEQMAGAIKPMLEACYNMEETEAAMDVLQQYGHAMSVHM